MIYSTELQNESATFSRPYFYFTVAKQVRLHASNKFSKYLGRWFEGNFRITVPRTLFVAANVGTKMNKYYCWFIEVMQIVNLSMLGG